MVPTKFIEWLPDEGLTTPDAVALVAQDETRAYDQLVTGSTSVVGPLKLGERSGIMALFRACRTWVTEPAKRLTEEKEQLLDTPVARNLRDAWWAHHHFRLGNRRTLVGTLQGKLYKQLTADPVDLYPIVPEELRLQCSFTKKDAALMVPLDGNGTPKGLGQTISIDPVAGFKALKARIDGYFFTVCYLSIETPEWFPLQTCFDFLDEVDDMMQQWKGPKGLRPSLEFYKTAYMRMMVHFCTRIRDEHKSMKEVCELKEDWKSLWKWDGPGYSEIAAFDKEEKTPVGHLPPDVQSKIDSTHALVKSIATQKPMFDKKGKGKGKGKGGGKGGGGGKGWRPQKQGQQEKPDIPRPRDKAKGSQYKEWYKTKPDGRGWGGGGKSNKKGNKWG